MRLFQQFWRTLNYQWAAHSKGHSQVGILLRAGVMYQSVIQVGF